MTRKRRKPSTPTNKALDTLLPIYKRHEPTYTTKQLTNMTIGLILAATLMTIPHLIALLSP